MVHWCWFWSVTNDATNTTAATRRLETAFARTDSFSVMKSFTTEHKTEHETDRVMWLRDQNV